MTRFGWTIAWAIIGVVVLMGGFLIWRHSAVRNLPATTTATSTPAVNPSTLSIYTSGQYGFSFFYPSDAQVTDAYSASTSLSSMSWRVGSTGSGTPVVSIKKGSEEVRVGISTDPSELKACTQIGPAEQPEGAFTVGSTTWQKFSFQKIGTDNEQQITSYRIMHDKTCYAVELFEPLSGTASTTGYTLGDMITSFSFAD